MPENVNPRPLHAYLRQQGLGITLLKSVYHESKPVWFLSNSDRCVTRPVTAAQQRAGN